ncbi:MAG: hypothetical protein IJ756_02730 [Paludibacteraceae bacterium]|nr:hypothetical protein [Paludibacteraceae bacterium]
MSNISKAYGPTSDGVKVGASSNAGNFTISLSASGQVTPTSIVVYCKLYNSNKASTVNVNNIGAQSVSSSWGNVTFSTSTALTSLTIASSKYIWVKSITINYTPAASCTTTPTVTAGSNSSVTSTTATVSCSSGISSLGSAGCSISSYGFVIGPSSNPSIGGSGVTKHEVGTTYTITGTLFYKDLTGLSAETTYYVRPYATNGNGTGYGTQTIFTTPALPTYTVILKDDNSTYTQASYGASVTLPSRDGCTGYTFAGWTKSWATAQTTWTTTAPTIITAGSYTPTANENLYPVYTKTDGGGTSTQNITYSGSTTNMTGNNDAATLGLDADSWSVVAAKGGNSNYPGLNTAGDIRLYYHADGGNTITITAPMTITSVSLTFTGDNYYNNAWVKVNGVIISLSDGVYPINATSFVIGNANTSNIQVRISNIAVNYSSSTTSYISVPNCCNQLGAINGSLILFTYR